MLEILRKFFDFCGGENKKKFYLSVVFGILLAFFEALKIPAISVIKSLPSVIVYSALR